MRRAPAVSAWFVSFVLVIFAAVELAARPALKLCHRQLGQPHGVGRARPRKERLPIHARILHAFTFARIIAEWSSAACSFVNCQSAGDSHLSQSQVTVSSPHGPPRRKDEHEQVREHGDREGTEQPKNAHTFPPIGSSRLRH